MPFECTLLTFLIPHQAHYNLYSLLSEVAKTRPEFEQESIEHLHKAAEAEILLAMYALATRYSEVSHESSGAQKL